MEETEKQESDSSPFEHDEEQIGQAKQAEDVESDTASEGGNVSTSSKEMLDEFLKQHKADNEKNISKEQIKEAKKENPAEESK